MSYASLIEAELRLIRPGDLLEMDHLGRARAWVRSGAPLCRLAPPASPPMHLVSNFPVVDQGQILLGDHISSGLWLPPGRHVAPGQHPRQTVIRECREGLRMAAVFVQSAPAFLTITETSGAKPHEDVALWYLLQGKAGALPEYDIREYRSMRWFRFADAPFGDMDPDLERLLGKMDAQSRAA